MIRCEGFRFMTCSTVILIVALNFNFPRRIKFAKPMNQVVSEGIVVIDDQDHVRSRFNASIFQVVILAR